MNNTENKPSFSLAEINEFLTGLSLRDLANAILQAQSPEQIIGSLPAQTLYALVKNESADSAKELIAAATDEQYQLMLDLELWDKDNFSDENLWHWLSIVDEKTALSGLARFVKLIDKKLIANLICRFVRSQINEEPTDMPIDPNSYTPDKGFTWVTIDTGEPEKDRELGRILAYFFETDPDYFYRLLYMPQVSTATVFEEEAFVEHQQRLQSVGIPDLRAACQINAPLSKERFLELIGTVKETPALITSPYIVPQGINYLEPWQSLCKLLPSDALTGAEQKLTAILNASLIFYNVSFYDFVAVGEMATQIKGAINIGLEKAMGIAKLDLDQFYYRVGLTGLYQLGLNELRQLRTFAVELTKQIENKEETSPHVLTALSYAGQAFPAFPLFLEQEEVGGLYQSSRPRALEHLTEICKLRDYLAEEFRAQ
ncbi:MAG: hypothetical protein IT292_08375 [Deltaproteobacteria bacterium]|nr:hypothetical protein [Deltaproteobacteria bacterium]